MVRRVRVGWGAVGVGWIGLALFGAGASLQGQEGVSDSLQVAIKLHLERLTRRLGDSVGLVPVDSAEDRSRMTVSPEDSVLQTLLSLKGYDLIRYQGESARFETESRMLTISGSDGQNAVVNRQGFELSADSALVMDEKTGRLVTVGNEAAYSPDTGDEVLTRRLIFDLNQNRGTAVDVRTQMNSGMGDWIVQGDFPWVSEDVSYGHEVMFTSCEEEDPHYHFLAREIKVSPGGTLIARNVLIYFSDVGVFWLPFIAQSTAQGRRSGLLPIRFSVNDIVRTSGNYSRRVSNLGYYWAMSDYSDVQLGMDWWSGNYAAVTGGFRYRWLRQFLEGQANFRQFWRSEGGSELAFDTNHDWELSERTRVRISARYASSAAFVRRNSFDPREVTQSIDSEGGLNRRFDWGNLSVSANRRQFLSEDRVETTLPTANLSLSTLTLFPALPTRSRFYNNMTLSASGRLSRSLRDLPEQDLSEAEFSFQSTDSEAIRGGISGSLSAGAFSISQSVELNRNITRDLPANFFDPAEAPPAAGIGSVGDLAQSVLFQQAGANTDFQAEELTWSTTIDYQQPIVGSTTLTPRLSISGRSIRSDTTSVAGGRFVAAPRRLSLGVQLNSDIYGFYRGDRIRHKFSPTFDYAYSPETQPTQIQEATFGSRAIQPINEIRIGLTQTLEGRVGDEEEDSASVQVPDASPGEPRRLPRSEKVMFLALRTSAVTYDFEQASELGHFNRGFADNLRISNQVSSDYLRGLSVSLEHDIFDDSGITGDGGIRKFDPQLSNVNLSFSLNNRSSLFRWLGGRSDEEEEPPASQEEEASEDLTDPSGFDAVGLEAATVVPGFGEERNRGQQGAQRSGEDNVGEWNASLSYSLARTRGAMDANQMLQATLAFQPTEKWSVNWRTSYNVEAGVFNDHIISFQRDLHRWEADFSFRQTATGNWTFMFEVALTDNRDLHFDYEQRTAGENR